MNKKPDIVVVGGGPCGSYAAYTAAKLGAKVMVCEDHKEIGVPNHCAGHLNISSLKRLGIHVPPEIIENEIKGAVFYSPSGKEFVLRRRCPVTYVIDRKLFDKHLAELAMKAGVDYRFNSRVKSLLFDSGYVKGVALKGEERLEANVVIDAEGCSSAVLKKTELDCLKAFMMVRGIQAEVDGLEHFDEDMVEVYLGRNVAPDFFAWIIPIRDGTAKVGLATRTGDPRDFLRRFMKKHPVASKKLKNSQVKNISLHPIPLAGPIPKTYSDGFLVVGDAASQVKPTTGGGVIFGLTCARAAGEVAYEAVKNSNFSEAFLSGYQRRWKRLVGFDLSAMLKMRRMINSLSDNRTEKIIGLCNRLGIDDVLEKSGDLDFQGRSLIPMIKYPGTLAVISYFLYSWLTSSTKH
ncbi:NAD(P)/FAD-dependent oxidoreductase [Candidatus Bathyarchaeota archaeon]|nr:NAD(P)/FAD-dependent oxidoreductase [Candidatus Bathyarchaeota archaeon]